MLGELRARVLTHRECQEYLPLLKLLRLEQNLQLTAIAMPSTILHLCACEHCRRVSTNKPLSKTIPLELEGVGQIIHIPILTHAECEAQLQSFLKIRREEGKETSVFRLPGIAFHLAICPLCTITAHLMGAMHTSAQPGAIESMIEAVKLQLKYRPH